MARLSDIDKSFLTSGFLSCGIWCIPFILAPLVSDFSSEYPWLRVVIALLIQGVVGFRWCLAIGLQAYTPGLLIGGLAHLVGGLALSTPVIFGLGHNLQFWSLCLVIEALWHLTRAARIVSPPENYLTITNFRQYGILILPFLTLFIPTPWLDALDWHHVNRGHLDGWYFAGITQSLAELGVSDNFSDSGASIAYQWLSFAAPAALRILGGVSANSALWGSYVPFLKFLCPLLLSWGVIFSMSSLPRNSSLLYRSWFVGTILILGLYALHPRYLLQLELTKIFWPGIPNFRPLRPPEILSSTLLGWALVMIGIRHRRRTLAPLLVLALVILLIPLAKLSVWPAFGYCLAGAAFYWFIKSKDPWLLFLVISTGLFGTLLGVLVMTPEMPVTQLRFEPGYFLEQIAIWTGLNSTLAASLGTVVIVGYWALPKLSLLLLARYANPPVKYSGVAIVFAATGIFLTALPALLFRVGRLDHLGNIVDDISRDLPQFLGAGLFASMLVGIAFVPRLLHQQFSRRVLYFICAYCLALSLLGLQLNSYPTVVGNQKWEADVRETLAHLSPSPQKLLAMESSSSESGQLLASSGIGPWWLSVRPADQSGYRMNGKNLYRDQLWDQLFDETTFRNALSVMKAEGVTHIVAIPKNREQFESLHRQGYLSKVSEWVFALSLDPEND